MRRWVKGLFWAVSGTAIVIGAGLLALQRWVGSDDFRLRVQSQAEDALGVPVVLGRLQVDPWPVPAVALDAVELRSPEPLTAQRIALRLRLDALLAGRLEVASLVLQGADLPQGGIDALLATVRGKAAHASSPGAGSGKPPGSPVPLLLLPRRLQFERIHWRNNRGEATTFDADARLDLHGLPETLELTVSAGAWQGARVQAIRTGAAPVRPQAGTQRGPEVGSPAGAKVAPAGPSWDIQVQHAGGSIEGVLSVQDIAGAKPQVSVQGQFVTRNLELSAMRKGRPGPLSGRLQANTTFSGRAASTSELGAVLVTHSRFTVQDAVVNGIDLAKAVQTVGLSRGGRTQLDSLSGQVTTRGRAIAFSNLAASSGTLSATGDITVAPNRALSGRINVNLGAQLVGKAVGVPLVVAGTLDAPTVMLTRSALVGAAIGTLVMPGVGTGAGASLGDAIGDKLKGLFGK